ncbi:MAG: helix-turn-helix transcriptional regulator [Campylobacteraceae bacterium]|nr:helix-turn-helix transcriptional regulator [Campylobacteraceae bacterium]
MDCFVLPQVLYSLPNIRQILLDEENCILYKELNENIINRDKLFISHSIVYVINGKVRINTYEGKEIIVENQEMVFMPRDSYIVSDYLKNDKNMQVILFFFNHDIALKFLGNKFKPLKTPNNTSPTSICKLQVTKNIRHYLANIQSMNFVQTQDKTMLELKLLEFLYLLQEADNDSFIEVLQASEYNKKKRDIETTMLEHFDKNISIRDFASLSGRSLSSFNRDFKLKHGKTPKKWLINKKMHKAKDMLKDGYNVTHCSTTAGYNNVSNFIKAYKSIHGTTPKKMHNPL